MKTLNIILLFVGLAVLPSTQSCTDLTEKVYDQVPTEQFGNAPKEIAALVGPIYNSLRNYGRGNNFMLADQSADMSVVPTRKGGDWWDGGQNMFTKQHTWTNNNVSYITGLYNDIFGGIITCNRVLQLVEAKTDLVGKDQIIAEIRGVRAFWYYVFIDDFGQGPLVTSFVAEAKLPVSSSRKVLYDFVISELNLIKNQLRSDVTSASYGKFTKGAAYSLLAKMYLNAGVWNPEGGTKWAECIAACDSVLALPYSLEADWEKTFQVKNEDAKEIIFPVVFKAVNGGQDLAYVTLHYLDAIALGLNIAPWNGLSADPNYVKEYDPADKRLNWSFLIGPMIDPATGKVLITANGRPLIHTVDITMYEATGTNWGWCNQEDGARCWKWEIPKGLSGDMDNDFAIFRIADIDLMKAECLVRINGNGDATATALVNTIRRRAFDPEKPIANVSLDDIRKERRFEFAWEMMSRQDNIRFGTFLNADLGWRGVSDTKRLLFPIPKDALDVNPGLTQNPGY